jgi:predicted Fe-Mo cluster-binding NifX family protein
MSQEHLIALPIENDGGLDAPVSEHFGHAASFALVAVRGCEIVSCRVVPNPLAESHQPGLLPRFVRSTGAGVLLAGGMGPRAVDLLQSFGIRVATGASGRVRDAVTAYLEGRLDGISPCEHGHDHGGGCHDHGGHE